MKIHPVSTTTNSKPLIARFKKLLTIIIVFNNFLGFFLVIPADHHADVAKGLVRRIFDSKSRPGFPPRPVDLSRSLLRVRLLL